MRAISRSSRTRNEKIAFAVDFNHRDLQMFFNKFLSSVGVIKFTASTRLDEANWGKEILRRPRLALLIF